MLATAERVAESGLLERIGDTPLLKIGLACRGNVTVWAKAEFLNPGGSVKDRPALNMIRDGEARGLLVPGKILLDSTSGNTGIAYAMIGAAKGYQVKLCVPANASLERKRILKAYGAELVLTNAAEGSDGAIRRCQRIYSDEPHNISIRTSTTIRPTGRRTLKRPGPEIIEQTEGRITHFVAALGTSGTFTGVTRRLREKLPHVQCYSAQPSHRFTD